MTDTASTDSGDSNLFLTSP